MTPNELRALAEALDPSGKVLTHPGNSALQRAADYLRAQADAQPVAVPAGWKWVPVEPTPEMLSAVGMMDGYDWHAPGCSPDADHANWYSAMIAAAPAAPQAEPHRNQPLRDLLAVIHCDGGHHTEAVGIEQSIKDALSAVCVLKGKLAQAEPKREPTCLWSRADDDTDVWETSCGHAFTIIEGTPSDNHMEFCCYCGRRVDEEIGGSDE